MNRFAEGQSPCLSPAGLAHPDLENGDQGRVLAELQPRRAVGPTNLRQEIAEGLFYTHVRLSHNTNKTLEASAFLYGLVELLEQKGLINIQELDERKKIAAERLVAQLKEKGLGVMLQDEYEDKYSFEGEAKVDCENRIQFCHAACCRLRFALSKQDVYEGVIKWELGKPYLIAHDKDGYCTHFEHGSCRCTVREQRPVPCRGYDCSNDKRIWVDFENKVVNPNINRPDWPRSEVATNGNGQAVPSGLTQISDVCGTTNPEFKPA